jgi:hypothetical protein
MEGVMFEEKGVRKIVRPHYPSLVDVQLDLVEEAGNLF